MPDPDRLLRTLAQASKAFRDTPGRRGHLVCLEDADEVLVAGDLHGNVENFRRILTTADLAQRPRRHLVLQELVHGPYRYPTGGDKSHQLVDLLAALKCQFPARVHLLLGNHELAQWTNHWIAKAEQDLNELFRAGVEFAYAGRANEIYAAYLELFAAVPLAVRTPNRVFLSHSLPTAGRLEAFDAGRLSQDGVDAKDLGPGGFVYALVWGRDTKPATVTTFLQKVDADLLITGHIPCPEGYAVPNDRQLILDSLGSPAAYCLFPTNHALSHSELVGYVRLF
jgi:Calcineurin-like phosphoesterase